MIQPATDVAGSLLSNVRVFETHDVAAPTSLRVTLESRTRLCG
jgi:hypothetical protein